MPRIDPVPARRVGVLQRLAYRVAARLFGQVPEPMTVWSHAPAVFWSQTLFESAVVRTWRQLPARLAVLAELRASSVIGCPWCLDFGSVLARRSGVTESQLRNLHRWFESDEFDLVERLVLTYADAMTATPMTVDDDIVDTLRETLGDPAVVELTALIAVENQRSRFNHAAGITSQGYTNGACALPVTSEASSTPVAG